jgi:hypothetical protein
MFTNFLTRVIIKAFTFILISTLLTLLIVTIYAADALSLDTAFDGDGMVTSNESFTLPRSTWQRLFPEGCLHGLMPSPLL